MMRQLILIHGRAQQHKDSLTLKAEWIESLRTGLAKSGLELPVPETAIRFPYYGDTLFQVASRNPSDHAAEVVVRGAATGEDKGQQKFVLDVLNETLDAQGIDDSSIQEELAEQEDTDAPGGGTVSMERGVLNWGWVQAALRVIDRRIPFGSGSSIALFTNDVYQYLNSIGIRDQIDTGVRKAFSPNIESVVVSHSLGTVVAYSLLGREGEAAGWKVPLFVTLGSPLAVTAIKKAFRPIKHPRCVERWLNARDPKDVVSLYPLDDDHFGIDPSIDNITDVRNHTDNRHGIAGYLDDAVVAKRIYEALVK